MKQLLDMTKGVPFWVAPFFVNKSAGFVHRLVFVVDLVYRKAVSVHRFVLIVDLVYKKAIFVHRILDNNKDGCHGGLR